jgi:SAM-dependent methyltransferase
MKLSELVALKNMLVDLPVEPIQRSTNAELDKIIHLLNINHVALGSHLTKAQNSYQSLQDAFNNFQQQVHYNIDHITKLIEHQEKYWLTESYKIYDTLAGWQHDAIMNMLRPIPTPETKLRSRIQMYADWRYPAMIIRPGIETFIDDMVSYDPLYIVDVNYDLIGKSLNKFNQLYQNRLRPVVIDENLGQEILEKIPNNQFGMCLVYNFFNHRTIEHVKKYLDEIYQKLRPGGVLLMTFNDCDRVPGVVMVEDKIACYTPGTLITQMAKNIGYDRFYTWNQGLALTYLELKKPGELNSLRGGQTLARIVPIPISPKEQQYRDLLAEAQLFGFTVVKGETYPLTVLTNFIAVESKNSQEAREAHRARQLVEWDKLSEEEKQTRLAESYEDAVQDNIHWEHNKQQN